MKASIFAVLLTTSLAEAQFNAMLALLKTFKLTAPLECAMPCILESANKVPCDGGGPANTICSNIEKIAEGTRSCTKKCNSEKANGTYPSEASMIGAIVH